MLKVKLTHVRTISTRQISLKFKEWPQQEVKNSINILFYDIKWERKIDDDGVEALTWKSQARFQII